MRIFKLFDEDNSRYVGTLLYYEREKTFICELEDDLDEWTAPFHFAAFVKRGIYTIPRDESLRWVRSRIIPPSRQNIDLILQNHRLKEYDERIFLELSHGRCSQDSIRVESVSVLPDYVIRRQEKNLTGCIRLSGHCLLCVFADGTVRKIDIESMAGSGRYNDIGKVLNNEALYDTCRLGTGGYYITFNDSIDIPSGALYGEGVLLPVSPEDLRLMVIHGLLDTTSACDMLNCTRQNLSYMMGKGAITPVVTGVKGNLFLRDDVLRNMW